MTRCAPEPISIEELEEHRLFAAWIVARFGDVYAPIFERVEREIAARRAADAPAERARRLVASLGVSGPAGLKAIRSSHSAFCASE